jgi:hypothetical protein
VTAHARPVEAKAQDIQGATPTWVSYPNKGVIHFNGLIGQAYRDNELMFPVHSSPEY